MLYNFCYKLSSREYKIELLIPVLLTLDSMYDAGIRETPYASLVIKLVNGIVCYVARVWSAKEGILWSPKLDPGHDIFFWVYSGAYQLTQAVAIGLPAFWGVNTATTVGWAACVLAVLLAYIGSTDLLPNVIVPKPPLFAWIALCACLSLSILVS